MDQDALVNERIAAGFRLLQELERSGFKISVAFWATLSEGGKPNLYISSPIVDEKGQAAAYRLVFAAMRQMPELGIERFDVRLLYSDDAMAKAAIEITSSKLGTWPFEVQNAGPLAGLIRYRGTTLGGVSVESAIVYPKTVTDVLAAVRFDDVPGFAVSWAGSNPFADGYCFGSEDGHLLFTDEMAVQRGPILTASSTASPINGLAMSGNYLAVSTPKDVCIWHLPNSESEFKNPEAVPVGACSLTSTASGYLLAPLGPQGVMVIDLKTSRRETMVLSDEVKKNLDFKRLTVLEKADGDEVLVCAVGLNGIALVEFVNGRGKGCVQTRGFKGWDVIDICPLSQSSAPYGIAALSRDGTIGLFRDVLSGERPKTIRFGRIIGEVKRIFSCRGHIVLLTTHALYLLGNLAASCSVSSVLTESSVGVAIEALEANLYKDRWLLIVRKDRKASRADIVQLEAKLPKIASPVFVEEITPVLSEPEWVQEGIEQEMNAVEVAL